MAFGLGMMGQNRDSTPGLGLAIQCTHCFGFTGHVAFVCVLCFDTVSEPVMRGTAGGLVRWRTRSAAVDQHCHSIDGSVVLTQAPVSVVR